MRGLRVLVVDDDDMVLRATSRVLTRAGFDVVSTADPRTARILLAQAAVETEGERYAVVVSDLDMPYWPGDMLCLDARGKTPFILLSGSTAVFDRARACGARAAFLKPVDTKTLVASVRDAARSSQERAK